MAKPDNTSTEAPAEKKKRKAPEGPRKVRPIFVLLGLNEAGAPAIHIATYDAMHLVTALQANPTATVQQLSITK